MSLVVTKVLDFSNSFHLTLASFTIRVQTKFITFTKTV